MSFSCISSFFCTDLHPLPALLTSVVGSPVLKEFVAQIIRLRHLSCKDRLRAGAAQPGEEKAVGRPESGLSVSKGAVRK